MWRLVTDRRLSATLTEVETQWTITQAIEAHVILDTLDELDEAIHRKESK